MPPEPPEEPRRKFYFDGGQVAIAAHLVYELDANGRQLRVVQFTDYTAEQVRTLYTSRPPTFATPGPTRKTGPPSSRRWPSGASTSTNWPSPPTSPTPTPSTCSAISRSTPRYGPGGSGPDACEPNARTFWDQYSPEARAILDELLEKYAAYGAAQFVMPDVLEVPPISRMAT